MKKMIPAFLVMLLFLSSCQERVVEETWPDGSPKRICWYSGSGNNREMVKEMQYWQNKKLRLEGTYKHNQRDGKWTVWYENGNLWSEGFFSNGRADGSRTTYFENGKVRYQAYYTSNVRTGIWRFYDEQGNLLQEVNYTTGKTRFETPRVDSLQKEEPVFFNKR